MKLIRFGPAGAEKPGLLTKDGVRVDVSAFGQDWDEAFLGADGLARLERWAGDHLATAPPVPDSERLGAPITRPSKIICIGLNYADHARESGVDLPKEPVLFFKATTACSARMTTWSSPGARPRPTGRWSSQSSSASPPGTCRRRKPPAASRDTSSTTTTRKGSISSSERVSGSRVRAPTPSRLSGPSSPPRDEVGDPQTLGLWLTVNGEGRQKSNTKNMAFGVFHLVSYVSQFMTLLPGDVISTGTPPGVGLGMDPPVFLKAGDVVELGIDGLGQQRQRVVPSV